jgi:LPXTG-motif cell wall-anchored protein
VKGFVKRRIVPVLPVLLLVGLTSAGLANAFQADGEEGPDLGPQPADYGGDVTSYLVGAAEYRAAAKVAASGDSPTVLQFTVTGCAEGAPVAIAAVPRVLAGDELAANDALADDDATKLAQEAVVLVDEAEALADGSAYELTMPSNLPLGFARLRVSCQDASGAELTSDTVIDIVDPVAFEAAQAEADEPLELATAIDGKAVAAPTAPPADDTAGTDAGAVEEEELPSTGVETTLLLVIGASVLAAGVMIATFSRRLRRA